MNGPQASPAGDGQQQWHEEGDADEDQGPLGRRGCFRLEQAELCLQRHEGPAIGDGEALDLGGNDDLRVMAPSQQDVRSRQPACWSPD